MPAFLQDRWPSPALHMPDQLAAQLRMLIGYTAHDLRAGKPADARCYLAALKAVLASPAISPRPGTSS